ncbi:diguanylate cyclase [Trichloromonas sp.]|uniref:diguanylate cyclase n=1 Tax=Trichloromonas sp. TaxID=3069249 RepID=UPI002A3A9BA2|nr:diguanylate cyclase [Trichloromonas sp.]
MYIGETAEVLALNGSAVEIGRLKSMGLREGKLIDLLLLDLLFARKLVIGLDNSRIAFHADLAERILVRPLKSHYEYIKAQAYYDKLTSCLNRHVADTLIREEVEKFVVKSVPFSLLLADVDHFKRINDTYGHQMGDGVLRDVSEVLRRGLRRSDALCRWGGDEFLILLRGTVLDEAKEIAERLRQKVESFALPLLLGHGVTVSIGGSGLPPGRSLDRLFAEADSALYAAKATGRNRVSIC